jgi:hypothetical protein
MVTLSALALAACETLPPGAVNVQASGRALTNEEAFGPAATGAEITEHFSGTSFTSLSSELHYGSDGGLQVFDLVNDGPLVIGEWRVDSSSSSDLLVQEGTIYQLKDGNVVSGKQRHSYRVFIQPNGNVSFDQMVEGKFDGGTMNLGNARKGFPREAEFDSARKHLMEGGSAEPGQAEPKPQNGEPNVGTTILKVVGGAVVLTVVIALCVASGVLCAL